MRGWMASLCAGRLRAARPAGNRTIVREHSDGGDALFWPHVNRKEAVLAPCQLNLVIRFESVQGVGKQCRDDVGPNSRVALCVVFHFRKTMGFSASLIQLGGDRIFHYYLFLISSIKNLSYQFLQVFHTLLNVPYAFPAPRNTNFPLGRARESTTRYEHGDSRRFHGNDVSVPLVRVPTNAGIRSSDPQGIATIRRFHPLVFGYDRMSTTRTRYVSLRRCGCVKNPYALP